MSYDVPGEPSYHMPGFREGDDFAMRTYPHPVYNFHALQEGMKTQEEVTNFLYAALRYRFRQQERIVDAYQKYRGLILPNQVIWYVDTSIAKIGDIRNCAHKDNPNGPWMLQCIWHASGKEEDWDEPGEFHDVALTLWGPPPMEANK